jgi:hypothetical protein
MSKRKQKNQRQEGDLQLICTYCSRSRNAAGLWERNYDQSYPVEQTSHGICPRCLKRNFPGVYTSLCREGKISLEDANC